MLKIFQGKTKSPNYRLVTPPDGKLQTITVKEEVRPAMMRVCIQADTPVDDQDKAVYLGGSLEKCEAHTGEIRILHRAARQTSSESRSATNIVRNWHA